MMRIAIVSVLLAGLAIASFQFYGVEKNTAGLKAQVAALQEEAAEIQQDNQKIDEKIKYLGRSDNLIKELKAKFNYRLPDEKTIIVAPKEKRD